MYKRGVNRASLNVWKDPDRLEMAAVRLLYASAFGVAFSIAIGQTLFGVAVLGWTVWLARARRLPTIPLAAWLCLLFFVVVASGIPHGVNPERSVSKVRRLFWFMALPVASSLIRDRRRVAGLLTAFACGCGVQALESCLVRPFQAWRALHAGTAHADDLYGAVKHMGSMTDGQMLMAGILALLGLITVRSRTGRPTLRWWLLLVLLCLAEVVNMKRGSWVCTLGLAVVFVAGQINWKYALMVVVIAAGIVAIPPVRQRIAETGDEFHRDSGGRATMWLAITPAMLRDYPWGIGYGAMTSKLMHDYDRHVEPYRSHLHSNIAQVLVETGWLGFAVYFAWMATALRDAVRRIGTLGARGDPWRPLGYALLCMLLALLANGLVEYNFGDAELILVYGMVMGTCASGEAAVAGPSSIAGRPSSVFRNP
jgi:O-antigen ligase